MEVPTNPTRQSAFVWICVSFLISANEIRVSRGWNWSPIVVRYSPMLMLVCSTVSGLKTFFISFYFTHLNCNKDEIYSKFVWVTVVNTTPAPPDPPREEEYTLRYKYHSNVCLMVPISKRMCAPARAWIAARCSSNRLLQYVIEKWEPSQWEPSWSEPHEFPEK